MVQVLKRRENLREKYYTMQPTPRVERLRQTYLNLRNRAVIDRLRIGTRIMKETEGEPVITRRVKMFTALVRELPELAWARRLSLWNSFVTSPLSMVVFRFLPAWVKDRVKGMTCG